jgi:hypothetical protein
MTMAKASSRKIAGCLALLVIAATFFSVTQSAQASVHLEPFDQGYVHQINFEVKAPLAAREVCLRDEEYGPPDYVWHPESPGCNVSLAVYQGGEMLYESRDWWYPEGYESHGASRFTYGLSCHHTGTLQWKLVVSADDGSGWSQEAANRFTVAPCQPWHRTYMLPRSARGAVLTKLRGEEVNSLQCNGWSRQWGAIRCIAYYSLPYRTCVGVFRTSEVESEEFGWVHSERSATLHRRRCIYF